MTFTKTFSLLLASLGIAIATSMTGLGGIEQAGAVTTPAVSVLDATGCNPGTFTCEPTGIAFDPSGNTWIGDCDTTYLNKVSSGSVVTPIARTSGINNQVQAATYANGTIYYVQTTTAGGGAIYSVPASATSLVTPTLLSDSPAISDNCSGGIAVDSHGDVFWSSGTNPGFVYEHLAAASPSQYVTYASGLQMPAQIAFGPDGLLYVADDGDNQVMVVPSGGGAAHVYAAESNGPVTSLAFAPGGSGILLVGGYTWSSPAYIDLIARNSNGTAGVVSSVIATASMPANGSVSGMVFSHDGLEYSNVNGFVEKVLPINLQPTPAVNVQATATTSTADVTWSSPSFVGSGVTGYVVTASPGGATCSTTGATTCILHGLNPATHYVVSVVAESGSGNAASATTATATKAQRSAAKPVKTTTVSAELAATGANLEGVSIGGFMALIAGAGFVFSRKRRQTHC